MTARVIVALGRSDWEARVLAYFAHPVTDLRLVRRCVDGDDVRLTVSHTPCDAIVLSDATTRVGADLVTLARSHGIRVVALSDDHSRWSAMGVRDVLPVRGVEPASCVAALTALLREDLPAPAPAPRRGSGVLVAGFGGAAGRTSVVRELGRALATADGSARVLVADADVYHASLPQQMGVAVGDFSLLQACRAAESDPLDGAMVRQGVVGVADRLWLLPGLARPARWADLRRAPLDAVWHACLAQFTVLIADGGPVLEPAGPGPDPSRAAATHSLLAACDSVVLCTRADALGISRLVRGYAECDDLLADKHVTVVAVGTSRKAHEREVEKAVVRLTGLQTMVFLPHRPDAYASTERDGGFAAGRDRDTAKAFDHLARIVLPPRVVAPHAVSTQAIDDYLRPRAA